VRPTQDAHSQMEDRGQWAMGFSPTTTTHHFYLKQDGGVIQVEVNDSGDIANRTEIRMHLGHIARAFQVAEVDIPVFVHGQVAPEFPR
jgi:hypothetical protein